MICVANYKEMNAMPWGNKTGPNGAGPLTGRGLGDCAGAANVNYGVRRGVGFGGGFRRGGRGAARGMGMGRGFGFYPYAAPTVAPTSKESLQQQREFLQNQLNQIDKDLETL